MVISWIFNIHMKIFRMPAKVSIGKEKNIMKGWVKGMDVAYLL